MSSVSSCRESYLEYIKQVLPSISTHSLEKFSLVIKNTSWDEPKSSADWNNTAVVAMSKAETCGDNLVMRSLYIEMAIEALKNGLEIDNHPTCATHLALIYNMIGEVQSVLDIAGKTFVNALHPAYTTLEKENCHYLFFPFPKTRKNCPGDLQLIEQILCSQNIYKIIIFLLTEILWRTNVFFCNSEHIRLLYLAAQFHPNFVNIGLRLGISNLMIGHTHEGILYLHQTRNLFPSYSPILQSLYLAYRRLKRVELANYWQETARKIANSYPSSSEWEWTKLPIDSPFTYVPFADNLLMAVEASFQSIVTHALMIDQDWFEKEMEFWRTYIQPGMTVIDVGANAGVYTFSAAAKVGNKGRVFAVEPFSGCVRYLQETCRINQLSWVKVCPGAASNINGKVKLLLQSANELNQVVTDELADIPVGSFEEVSCFTLDSLITEENISNVDFLKLDAEGHEIAILAGSQQLINRFYPVILYENIMGKEGANIEVSQWLKNIGYQLFYYQPYTQQLIPLNPQGSYENQLNLIAVPPDKMSMFNL
jgi:FkbM family methyltransferase